MQEILKHILIIGLNDKDTLKQVLTIKQAKNIIIKNCLKVGYDGGTLSTVNGFYKMQSNNKITIEKSIKLELLFASDTKTKILIDLIKKDLNQETVALQVENITSDLI